MLCYELRYMSVTHSMQSSLLPACGLKEPALYRDVVMGEVMCQHADEGSLPGQG